MLSFSYDIDVKHRRLRRGAKSESTRKRPSLRDYLILAHYIESRVSRDGKTYADLAQMMCSKTRGQSGQAEMPKPFLLQ